MILKRYIILGLILSTGFISACATGKPFESLPLDESTTVVYIYRPYYLLGYALNMSVSIEGHKIADIPVNGYTYIITTKAVLTISAVQNMGDLAHSPASTISLEIKKGKSYYVRMTVGEHPASRPSLELVEEKQALKEIQKAVLMTQEKVFFD
jgi:hypothetical protein